MGSAVVNIIDQLTVEREDDNNLRLMSVFNIAGVEVKQELLKLSSSAKIEITIDGKPVEEE